MLRRDLDLTVSLEFSVILFFLSFSLSFTEGVESFFFLVLFISLPEISLLHEITMSQILYTDSNHSDYFNSF